MEMFSNNCWSGRLCIKGLYPCTAHTEVQNGIEVLADWGKCLNIRWRANASTTKDRFLKGLMELPYATEIVWNGWFINVFHMKPRQCPTNFEKLRVYLRKNSYMAVLRHGNEVMLMTDSQLMSELFGVSGQAETGLLCCILLSKQSKVKSGQSKITIKQELYATSDVIDTEFYEEVPESSKLKYADIKLAFQDAERDQLKSPYSPSKTCNGVPSVTRQHRYSTFIKEQLLEGIGTNVQRDSRKQTYPTNASDSERKYGKRPMIPREQLQQGESHVNEVQDNCGHDHIGIKDAKYPKLDSDLKAQTGKLPSNDKSPYLHKPKIKFYNVKEKQQGEMSCRNDHQSNTADKIPSATMNKTQQHSQSQSSMAKVGSGVKNLSSPNQALSGSMPLLSDNKMLKSPVSLSDKKMLESPVSLSDNKMLNSPVSLSDSKMLNSPVSSSVSKMLKNLPSLSDSKMLKSPVSLSDSKMLKSPLSLSDSKKCKSPVSFKQKIKERVKTSNKSEKWNDRNVAERKNNSSKENPRSSEAYKSSKSKKLSARDKFVLRQERQKTEAEKVFSRMKIGFSRHEVKQLGRIPKKINTTDKPTASLASPRTTSVTCDYSNPVSPCVGSTSSTVPKKLNTTQESATSLASPRNTGVTSDYRYPVSPCVDRTGGRIPKKTNTTEGPGTRDYSYPVSPSVGSATSTPTRGIPVVEKPVTSSRITDVPIISPNIDSSEISLENNRMISPSLGTSFENNRLISPSSGTSLENNRLISPSSGISLENKRLFSPSSGTSFENNTLISPSSETSFENNRFSSPKASVKRRNISPILESLAREICTPVSIQLERVDVTDELLEKCKKSLDYDGKSPKRRKGIQIAVDNSDETEPGVCVAGPAENRHMTEFAKCDTNEDAQDRGNKTVIDDTNTGLDEIVIHDTNTGIVETVILDTTSGLDETVIYDTSTGSDETVIYDTTSGSEDTLVYDSCTMGDSGCGDDYTDHEFKIGRDFPALSERGDNGPHLSDKLLGNDCIHKMIQSAKAEKRKLTRRKLQGHKKKLRETSSWLSKVLSKGSGNVIPGFGDLETVRLLDRESGKEDICNRTVVNSSKGPQVAISGLERDGESGKDNMTIEDTVNAVLHSFSTDSFQHVALDDLASLCVVVGCVLHQPRLTNRCRTVRQVQNACNISTYMIEIAQAEQPIIDASDQTEQPITETADQTEQPITDAVDQTEQPITDAADPTWSTVSTGSNEDQESSKLVTTVSPETVPKPANRPEDAHLDEVEKKVLKTSTNVKLTEDTGDGNDDPVWNIEKEKLKMDKVKLKHTVEMVRLSKKCTSELQKDTEKKHKNAARSPDSKLVATVPVVEIKTAETVPSESILDTKITAETVPSKSSLDTKTTAETMPSKSIIDTKITSETVPSKSSLDTKTTAETVPSKSTLDTKTTAQTVPSKSTFDTKTTSQTVPSKSTFDTKTTAQTVPSKSILDTKITAETMPSNSILDTKITAETVPSKSVLDTKITAETVPFKSVLDTKITAETVPSKSVLDTKTASETVPSKSTLDTKTTAQTVPSKFVLDTQITAETVSSKSTLDTKITAETIQTKSTLDTKITAETVPSKSTLDTKITAETMPTKSTLDTKITAETVPSKSTLDTKITAETVPSKSILDTKITAETVPSKSTLDTKATAQTLPSKSILDTKITAETMPTKSTLDTKITAETVPSKSTPDTKLHSNKENSVVSSESQTDDRLSKHTVSSDMKGETEKDHMVLEKTNQSKVISPASDLKNIQSTYNNIRWAHKNSLPNDIGTALLTYVEGEPPSLEGKTSKILEKTMNKVSYENNKGPSTVKEQVKKDDREKTNTPDNQKVERISKEPSPASKTDEPILRTKDKDDRKASARTTPTKDPQDQKDGREKIKFGRHSDTLKHEKPSVSKTTSTSRIISPVRHSEGSTRSTPTKDKREKRSSTEKIKYVRNTDTEKLEKVSVSKSTSSSSRRSSSPGKDKRHSQSSSGSKGSAEKSRQKESLQSVADTKTSQASRVDSKSEPIKNRLVSLAGKSVKPEVTGKAGKRQARQYHPYRKESRPVDKSIPAWSFDIAYRDMHDLLQNMTENQFQAQGFEPTDVSLWRGSRGRTNWKSRQGAFGRFKEFKFTRSLEPTTLPRHLRDNKEECDIMPEEIPNLKERQHQADLVEEMFIGEETDNFSSEKSSYCSPKTDDIVCSKIPDSPLSLTIPMGMKTSTYSGTMIDDDNEASVELAYSNTSRKTEIELW